MVTIHCQLTEQDYLEAQRLNMQPTGWARMLPIATLIIWAIGMILLLVYAVLVNSVFVGMMFSISFFALIIPLTNRVILPRQAHRLFQQNKELSAPQEIIFDTSGMQLTNRYGFTKRAWPDFLKWKEGQQCLLLFHSDLVYHAIPTRCFNAPEEIEFVREQLRTHNVPVAGVPGQLLAVQIMLFLLILFLVLMFGVSVLI